MDRSEVVRLKDELLNYLSFKADYRRGTGLQQKVLLVEGATDKEFVKNILSDDSLCITVVDFKKARDPFSTKPVNKAFNCKDVIITILQRISMFPEAFDFPKGAEEWPLYGLVDRDEGIPGSCMRVKKLFFTDTHDIETLMLSTDPDVLTRLDGCTVTEEDAKMACYLTDQLTIFRSAISDEGTLQYSAIKNDDGTTEFETFVQEGKIALEKMVDHINARIEAPLSREKLKKTKEKLAKNVKRYLDKNGEWKESFEDFSCGEEYWRRVNGHDLLSAIRYVNKSARECFSNEMRYSQNRDFELALSKAYDYECFKNTELYGKMNAVGLIRT